MTDFNVDQIVSFKLEHMVSGRDSYSWRNGIEWNHIYYYDQYYTGHQGSEQEGKLLWQASDLETNSSLKQDFHFSLNDTPDSQRNEVMLNIRLLSDTNSPYCIWNEIDTLQLTINGHTLDLRMGVIRGVHNIQAVVPAGWLNSDKENDLEIIAPTNNIVTYSVDKLELRDCEQSERFNPPERD